MRGKIMNNEIVEKWEKTGLLEEMDDFSKRECAYALDTCGNLLIGEKAAYRLEVDKVYGQEGFYAGTILPVISRLYRLDDGPSIAMSMSIEWLMEDFGEYIKEHVELYHALNSCICEDGERELVQMYVFRLENDL